MSDDETETAETELDCTGLKCPLPVLKARRAMRAVESGGVLKVLVTDPQAPTDFEHFSETTGHALLSCEAAGEGHAIRLRKV